MLLDVEIGGGIQRNHLNHYNLRLSLCKFSAMKQLLFLSVISIALSSCDMISGSGNIITQTRATGDFRSISASSGFNVELKTGPTAEIVLEADDNVMKYLETTVSGDNLTIGIKNNVGLSNAHLKAYITALQIDGIKASSGADVMVTGLLKNAGKLSFNASSAGTITADIDAPQVEADASSGASVKLSGKTKNFAATVSSGSNMKAGDLLSESTNVSASSGSHATVHASVNLKANASSGASINYFGAANVDKTVSSGGSVSKND